MSLCSVPCRVISLVTYNFCLFTIIVQPRSPMEVIQTPSGLHHGNTFFSSLLVTATPIGLFPGFVLINFTCSLLMCKVSLRCHYHASIFLYHSDKSYRINILIKIICLIRSLDRVNISVSFRKVILWNH